MKVILLNLAFLLSLVITSSCSKEKVISNDSISLTKAQALYKNISLIKNNDDAKLAYSILSPEERYNVWLLKLDKDLLSDSYSSQQKERIKLIKNYLSIDIFKEGDKREIFYTTWFPQWIKDNENLFDGIQITNLVFSIQQLELRRTVDGTYQALPIGGEVNFIAPMMCICALNSSFTCPSYTGSWPPSVNWGTCSSGSKCQTTTSGCGALWDQECDGAKCPSTSSQEL